MLLLQGVPVTPQDATSLASKLVNAGSPAAIGAAEVIRRAVRLEFASVTLTTVQREAILAVLESPPELLADLRGKLARDPQIT